MNDKGMVIFCDFDGTVTRQDVVDLMLEAFARPQWRIDEELWKQGKINARECLDRQMRCVQATESQLEELVQSVDIDRQFEALAVWARDSRIPLVLFSDGFDWLISRVFAHHGIHLDTLGIKVFSSHLEFRSGTLYWNFPFANDCVHGCGTCKPGLMQRFAPSASRALIGDGRSDSAAVDAADKVFAKSWLQQYCRSRGIAFHPFQNLGEVLSRLIAISAVSEGREALR